MLMSGKHLKLRANQGGIQCNIEGADSPNLLFGLFSTSNMPVKIGLSIFGDILDRESVSYNWKHRHSDITRKK